MPPSDMQVSYVHHVAFEVRVGHQKKLKNEMVRTKHL